MANPHVTVAVVNLEETTEVHLPMDNSEEEKSEAALIMEEEATSDSDPDLGQKITTEEAHISSNKWPTIAKLVAKWKQIFVTSCVFAVLLDPLFLYIPILSQNMECLSLDEKLKTAAIILRSVTDLFYIMDVIVQLQRYENVSSPIDAFRQRDCSKLILVWQSYIFIDILAVLPFPQVAILVFFPKMRSSKSLNTRILILNLIVLFQYVPRVLRIYLSCKELKKTPKEESTSIWVKGVLNFFMYILASHVLGAVWYFFAIQRVVLCWQSACQNENRCESIDFGCHDGRAFENVTFLNSLCPINSPNTTLFDFGIFRSALQSGLPRSTNYQQKLLNCFWWGLRNLSSLGSNLEPSIDAWENLFAAFISIIGLLLFLYLIGNLQTYMQLDTARIEGHRHRMKMDRKMKEMGREMELWLPKNGIPMRMKPEIMKRIEEELEENRDVDLADTLSILPPELHNYIASCMPLSRLKQVPILQKMDEEVLNVICKHLNPIKYKKDTIIIQEDEPLEVMLFIVEGLVNSSKRRDNSSKQQGAGEFYGENLLAWPSLSSFPNDLPSAAESVTAIDDVEALILQADDMKSIGLNFSSHFRLKESLIDQLEFADSSMPCRIFTLKDIQKATDNFHESRIIGQGAYGRVYEGILPDKRAVAIKKYLLVPSANQCNQFVNEVIVLSQIYHRNVVRLLGCCLEAEVPLMVFEFVSNGTLYEHIHQRNGRPTLSLVLRMKIAAETAGALAYLHYSTSMKIIHRDVKATNILLDEMFTAKLTDFGTSLVYTTDQNDLSTLVQGTLGYLDPEYLQSSILTEKSDVYSFGVVLVELITSREAISFSRPEGERNLATFFFCALENGILGQILDHEIVNEGNFETVEKVADLAHRCLHLKGAERPTMKEVAMELEMLYVSISQT